MSGRLRDKAHTAAPVATAATAASTPAAMTHGVARRHARPTHPGVIRLPSSLRHPTIPIPVLDGLGHVAGRDAFRSVKVGDGPGHL